MQSLLIGASLVSLALSSSSPSSSDENEFNYDGECDGYDHAYQIGILRYNDDMRDSLNEAGDTTFLEEYGEEALMVGNGGEPDGYDVNKRFFCTNDDNDNTKIYLEGYGFPLSVPVTAWLVCPPPSRTHALFQDEDGIGKLAEWQVPAQPTTAAYTSGRGDDINTLEVDDDRTMRYEVELDFDPTQTMQTPLPNRRATVLQDGFPASIGDEETGLYVGLNQNNFRAAGAPQDIAREFLRYFEDDGSQRLDENGRPELVRSPCAHTTLPLVGHTDFLTHGTDAALFYFLHMEQYERGDHFWTVVLNLASLTQITDSD